MNTILFRDSYCLHVSRHLLSLQSPRNSRNQREENSWCHVDQCALTGVFAAVSPWQLLVSVNCSICKSPCFFRTDTPYLVFNQDTEVQLEIPKMLPPPHTGKIWITQHHGSRLNNLKVCLNIFHVTHCWAVKPQTRQWKKGIYSSLNIAFSVKQLF